MREMMMGHERPAVCCRLRPRWMVFLALFLPAFLFAQAPGTNQDDYTQGRDYQKKLRFQKFHGNYLLFYDEGHRLYYLKYRVDRWDYKNDGAVAEFMDSVEYLVLFTYRGEGANENELDRPKAKLQPPAQRSIRIIKNFFYGDYKSHRQTQVERIRF